MANLDAIPAVNVGAEPSGQAPVCACVAIAAMTLKDVVGAWLWPLRGNSRLNSDTLWNDAIGMFSLAEKYPPPKEAVRAGDAALVAGFDDSGRRYPEPLANVACRLTPD